MALSKYKWLVSFLAIVAAAALVFTYQYMSRSPIKMGVLYSLTGNMSFSEKGMVDAVLLAVDEINQRGGLLGRKVEALVRDGKSSPDIFSEASKRLIEEDDVDVIFGCWTSSCRKSLVPIFEANDHLLYYALQYEGMEASKNVIYLGAVPNQQIVPALEWSFSKFGKRIYLIGSDYVYPHAANQVIKDQVAKWRGEIVGEAYVPLGSNKFGQVISDIHQTKPDVIFNTINGKSNLDFFRSLRASGISPDNIPTFSFSLSEEELSRFDNIEMAGDFIVSNYLQNIDNPVNARFVKRFKDKYGDDRVIGNSMQIAYMGVHLWAKAVEKAGTSDVSEVRDAASGISINGPSGMLYIEPETQHTWKSMYIAQVTRQMQLQSVWFSRAPIAPKPYPESRTEKDWSEYLESLKQQWGGDWQASKSTEQ